MGHARGAMKIVNLCLVQAQAASKAEVLQLQAAAKASQLQLHQLTSAVSHIGELEVQVR